MSPDFNSTSSYIADDKKKYNPAFAKVLSIICLFFLIIFVLLGIVSLADSQQDSAYLLGMLIGNAMIDFSLIYPHYIFLRLIKGKTDRRLKVFYCNIAIALLLLVILFVAYFLNMLDLKTIFISAFLLTTSYFLNAYSALHIEIEKVG
ncbi:hypothetical protein [Sinobacterium caligoides]|uniref:hypothetical protein n=1 Tax=Sinobacterium caligoides TaxID=933926 RepID=UPI0011CD36A0|nr:hypothetical protein [Sinobacterium caligoides]